MNLYFHRYFQVPFLFLLLLIIGSILNSCSQDNNSWAGRTYHDLLARDNPHFLARERMKELEVKVYDMKKDNYNSILHPIPPFDTLKTKSLQKDLDDIIKKSSIPVRRHRNSKFVDHSYILIGRCRMYKGEFKLGVDTYKYVNAQSKQEHARHEALIYLIRAYMAWNQYDNAKSVVDFLDKEKLNEKNKTDYYITKAEYLRHFEEYKEMIPLLKEAAPKLKKKDQQSRMYFILGQLYQEAGNDTAAYKAYRKTVKLNPPYEMLFISRLNMYQVASLTSDRDTKKIKQYFAKLLKDSKNADFKDKIYYEMGMFEYKQGNLYEAISNYKKSVKANTSGGYQKGLSFLKLAEIYYERLEDYENAALYYDSTAASLDKTDKRYPLVMKREKVLDEFVIYLKTIKREDSLLRLANMDSVSLNKVIDTLVAKEQDEYMSQQIALRKKKAQDAENALKPSDKLFANNSNNNNDPNAPPQWYFGIPDAVQQGSNMYIQLWGKRKLEDHWRRAKKEVVMDFGKSNVNQDSIDQADAEEEKQRNYIAPLKVDRSKYLKDIPFTDKQKANSNALIEEALYQVATIYNHKLDEPDRAIRTYEILLKRYPSSKYVPEVLYNLYLIYKDRNDSKYITYKDILLKDYPHSIYAKLILNPNYYRDSRIANKQAEKEYKEVFQLYKNKTYHESDSVANILLAKYPESDISDKLIYVKLLCKLKTKGPTPALMHELEEFKTSFPESPLIPEATDLIQTLEKATSDTNIVTDNSQ